MYVLINLIGKILSEYILFCVFVAEVLLQGERTEKTSDIDIRRGMKSALLASLIKALYTYVYIYIHISYPHTVQFKNCTILLIKYISIKLG